MKVCENVYQIKINFQVTKEIRRYVYIYLITGEHCYLIDAGVAGCAAQVEQYMNTLGRSIHNIKAILLTHAHPDHIGGAAEIKKLSNCRIFASEAEREWTEDIGLQFKERPIPNFYSLVSESVPVDQIVADGDLLPFENDLEIRVTGAQGHSKGDMAYILNNQIFFSGDAIPAQNDFPIFIDVQKSELTLEKIMALTGLQYCCPAWDRVYSGAELGQIIEKQKKLIKKLLLCVQTVEKEYPNESIDKKAEFTCQLMGWPQTMVNPLFIRSVKACMIAVNCP